SGLKTPSRYHIQATGSDGGSVDVEFVVPKFAISLPEGRALLKINAIFALPKRGQLPAIEFKEEKVSEIVVEDLLVVSLGDSYAGFRLEHAFHLYPLFLTV